MLHAYAVKFDVTENPKSFAIFFGTKHHAKFFSKKVVILHFGF